MSLAEEGGGRQVRTGGWESSSGEEGNKRG